MVDPITGIGLASSILTFIELAAKVAKQSWDYSRQFGDLPPDFQLCKDMIAIVARAARRLETRLREDPPRPLTEAEDDLVHLFKTLTGAVDEFDGVISDLIGERPFVKAVKTVSRERKIRKIRDQLDRDIVALLFVLQSDGGNLSTARLASDGMTSFANTAQIRCQRSQEGLSRDASEDRKTDVCRIFRARAGAQRHEG
jgi:hypothetical protein